MLLFYSVFTKVLLLCHYDLSSHLAYERINTQTFAVFVDEAFLAATIDEEDCVARAHTDATVTRRFFIASLRYDLNLQINQHHASSVFRNNVRARYQNQIRLK